MLHIFELITLKHHIFLIPISPPDYYSSDSGTIDWRLAMHQQIRIMQT